MGTFIELWEYRNIGIAYDICTRHFQGQDSSPTLRPRHHTISSLRTESKGTSDKEAPRGHSQRRSAKTDIQQQQSYLEMPLKAVCVLRDVTRVTGTIYFEQQVTKSPSTNNAYGSVVNSNKSIRIVLHL